jgi:CAAX prenyl protease-like protein
VAGVAAWIALAKLQLLVMTSLNLNVSAVARTAFNPFDEKLHIPAAWAYSFLAIRLFGLAIVVPVIEEFFLRGFVMRYVMAAEWWKVPFGTASKLALFAGTGFPVLTHPGEILAAAVWFSAITWLMLRTRNIWDCVAAHAVTNALLGAFVLWSGNWWLM